MWGSKMKRTPVTPINSVNDVEPGPRNFAHLASSQSVWLLNGANGLGDGPVGVGRSTASAHTRLVERSVSMS